MTGAGAPRSHRDPERVAAKLARLQEPHVAPLTALARRIAVERGVEVPCFDPADAGTRARALLLLESPGPGSLAGGRGTGLISCNNPDPTATNTFLALREAGLDRSAIALWNIVPWPLGAMRPPYVRELVDARPHLAALLGLLPSLRVVVLLGASARNGWRRAGVTGRQVLEGPHPSPQYLHRAPEHRPRLVATLRTAAEIAR